MDCLYCMYRLISSELEHSIQSIVFLTGQVPCGLQYFLLEYTHWYPDPGLLSWKATKSGWFLVLFASVFWVFLGYHRFSFRFSSITAPQPSNSRERFFLVVSYLQQQTGVFSHIFIKICCLLVYLLYRNDVLFVLLSTNQLLTLLCTSVILCVNIFCRLQSKAVTSINFIVLGHHFSIDDKLHWTVNRL